MKTLLIQLLVFCTIHVFGQDFMKGRITDDQQEPLPGVNILVEGTGRGTVSDPNGEFELSLDIENSVLVFTYIGYVTLRLTELTSNLSIILQPISFELENVEVSGFQGSVGKARRRVESIQSIPESVVTMTGEQIAQSGIHNVETFAAFVPNVSYHNSESVGLNFLNVRGIPQIRNGDSPVALIIDGVTIPDPNLLNQELYDLAMIEVVKGPQGALYGKNAIAGAINIVTMAPSNTMKTRIGAGYGNGNAWKINLASTGALVSDKVYYRLSGIYRNSDGLIENQFLNTPIDFIEDLSFRGQVKFDLSSSFVATLTTQLSSREGGAVNWAHNPNSTQLATDDFEAVIDAGVLGKSELESRFGSLRLEYGKGNIKFQSITSYNDSERFHEGDLDFTPPDILRQEQFSATQAINQEFRFSNHSGHRISWDAGAFYQHSEKDLITKVYADFGYFYPPFEPTGTLTLTNFVSSLPLSDFTNIYNTIALFGFVDYEISEKLNFSVGLRYDHDRIEQENRNDATNPDRTDQEIQPKASLAFKLTEAILLHANYGRGYRNAGYNAQATAFFNSEYDSEITNNIELGFKATSRNDRFILNASVFHINFNNQQQYAVALGANGLLLGNYNYNDSEVNGFEAELKYRTSRYVDVLLSYGYNDSKILDGGQAGSTDRTIYNGNHTSFTPTSSFSLGLMSDFVISRNTEFVGNLNWHGKGKIYWHEDNTDVSDPYSLLDARIGLVLDKKFEVALWGMNLLDTNYFQEYFAGESSGSATGDIAWFGQPRTYGIELAIRL